MKNYHYGYALSGISLAGVIALGIYVLPAFLILLWFPLIMSGLSIQEKNQQKYVDRIMKLTLDKKEYYDHISDSITTEDPSLHIVGGVKDEERLLEISNPKEVIEHSPQGDISTVKVYSNSCYAEGQTLFENTYTKVVPKNRAQKDFEALKDELNRLKELPPRKETWEKICDAIDREDEDVLAVEPEHYGHLVPIVKVISESLPPAPDNYRWKLTTKLAKEIKRPESWDTSHGFEQNINDCIVKLEIVDFTGFSGAQRWSFSKNISRFKFYRSYGSRWITFEDAFDEEIDSKEYDEALRSSKRIVNEFKERANNFIKDYNRINHPPKMEEYIV